MKHRVVLLGWCLLLAACSSGTTRTPIGAAGPTPTASHLSKLGVPPPTLSGSQSWHRDVGLNNATPEQLDGTSHIFSFYSNQYRSGWLMVWAGGVKGPSSDNLAQGAIWVDLNPDSRQSGPADDQPPGSVTVKYDVPNSPTYVKIVSVTGDIVALVREDGSSVSFNLQTRQFS